MPRPSGEMGLRKTLRTFPQHCGLLGAGLGLACAHAAGPAPLTPDKSCPPSAPAVSVPAAARDSLPRGVVMSNVKSAWAQIAREIPGGFGGVVSEGGVPVIYLVDTTRRSEAVAALVARGVIPRTGEERVRGGRWDFAQLYDWYRYLLMHFELGTGDAAGVVAWGIDERENRVWFGMVDEGARSRFQRALAGLPLPCFLVTLEVTGPYRPERH